MTDKSNFLQRTSRASADAKAGSKANSTYIDPQGHVSKSSNVPLPFRDCPKAATEPIAIPSQPASIQDQSPYGRLPSFQERPGSTQAIFPSGDRDRVANWLSHAVTKHESETSPDESSRSDSRHSGSVYPKGLESFDPEPSPTRRLSDVSIPTGTPPELRTAKRDFPVGHDQHNLQPYDVPLIQEQEWSRPDVYPHFMVRFARPRGGWTGELWDDFLQSELERMLGRDYQVMSIRFDRWKPTYEWFRDTFEKHLKASDTHNFVTSRENTRTNTVMRLGHDSSPIEAPAESSNKAFAQEISNKLQYEQTKHYRSQDGRVDSNVGSPTKSTKAPSVAGPPPGSIRSSKSTTSSERF